MAKRQCAIASHLKVAFGSWTWTEENPWPPWSAVIKAPLWKEPKYEGLRGLLQKPVAKPVCEKSDTGLVSIQCARESLVESSTGKLIAESGRVELMAMRCGVPVPSIVISLPFAACVIEVPRLYTTGLHNLVAQLLLSGVPVFIAGESADVKATVAALKATVAEDMYQCGVAIYILSNKTPLYTSTSHLVSICSATAFDNRLPRYVAFTEGPMSSVMPVEIFSFLLSLVPVPERAGNGFSHFGAGKIPKCFETGPFWDQKWVNNGSKTRFSKHDPGPFGMPEQVFLAHFEPVLIQFPPLPRHVCTKWYPLQVP